MIRTVIIDDKEHIRHVIADLLKEFCPDVKVVGTAGSVKKGFEVLQSAKPDLVFLDIQMPDGSGFDLLDMFDELDFRVIFVTAFDQFAIDAIKLHALDYILKPIDSDELVEAVEKYRRMDKTASETRSLIQSLKNVTDHQKLAVYSVGQIHFIDIPSIVRCESDGSYTNIHLINGTTILSTRLLKEYENLLTGHRFFRLHRSHIINMDHVVQYIKKERDKVVMRDGSVIEIHRKVRTKFLEMMTGAEQND